MAGAAPLGHARIAAALAAGLLALAVTVAALAMAPAVFAGEVLRWSTPWVPTLGLDLAFRIDGLAWLFVFLVGAIGVLVVIYAAWYLEGDEPAPRFYAFLMLFMAAMLGVVTAGNLLLLVVFWELTSLSSFLLIGWWQQRADARQGARMALVVTGAGGLCLLAGVLLIGHIVGSFSLDVVLASGDLIRAHALYETALALVLLGAFTKSAQLPFHFWLPHAMAAPTPVSAYLHSATMVKCGVFLLARLHPALAGSEMWFWVVSSVGLGTLLVGAYIAIFQHDLKGLLAYSTISHLGLITLLFGLDEPLATVAGVFHILNHATFKAGLFMAAGIIDHACGTRDMRRINGLAKLMPFTATLGIVAAAAMAGVPLLNGFLSKEMFFAETVAKDGHALMEWLLPLGATLAGVLSVAYSLRFVHDVFFNGQHHLDHTPHEPALWMRVPVLVLVLACLVVGLAPALVAGPVLAVAAQAAVFGAPGPALPPYTLAVWHGLNLPLLMSAVAVVGGVLLYFGLQRFVNLHRVVQLPLWVKSGGRDAFMALQTAVLALARGLTSALVGGQLQRYVLLLVLVALVAGWAPFFSAALPASNAVPMHLRALGEPNGAGLGMALVMALGMVAAVATTVLHRQRLLALVLMGAVGLVVCLVFAWFSAPDLALTQLLVEMVSIVLAMLALRWLPHEGRPEPRSPRRWWHGAVAGVVGVSLAALAWAVLEGPGTSFQSISPYFLDKSVPEGGGANVVNVILVDFRGFDTWGEITVLAIAALTVHALLERFVPPPGAAATTTRTLSSSPLMLRLAARLVLPFAALIAVHLFLRGHNLPGGGFIAGLVLSIGLVLVFVAHGQRWAGLRLGQDFRGVIGAGLLVAGATGVASALFGAPFLTSSWAVVNWPLVGGVPLASASMFDLGVFLVVVGATMVSLTRLAQLETRR